VKTAPELSDLIYLGSKHVDIGQTDYMTQAANEMMSFSEAKLSKLHKSKRDDWILYNHRQLSRTYPAGLRVDSSNYDPFPAWEAGCQLVAMNYQTDDIHLQFYRAKFSGNGGSGYLLKPAPLLPGYSGDVKPMKLTITVVCAQHLPKPGAHTLGEVVDPYVALEVRGGDCDASTARTTTVDNNGYSAVWEETFTFDIKRPDLAMLLVTAWDEDLTNSDFLGSNACEVARMRQGYRFLPMLRADRSLFRSAGQPGVLLRILKE
jgi:hypothetical protein